MEKLLEKYARVILETCLKIEKNQPLFISFNIERIDFVRIISRIALEMGVKDIYFEANDPYLKYVLSSETPGLMKDVDPEKISAMTKYSYETRKVYDEMRDKSELAWCIAAVPTEAWAKELFKNSSNPERDLWNKIFEICSITEPDPTSIWNEKIEKLKIFQLSPLSSNTIAWFMHPLTQAGSPTVFRVHSSHFVIVLPPFFSSITIQPYGQDITQV